MRGKSATAGLINVSTEFAQKESIAMEMKLLEEQKSNLLKEREKLTQAALKLNEERMKFEVIYLLLFDNLRLQQEKLQFEELKTRHQEADSSFWKAYNTPAKTPNLLFASPGFRQRLQGTPDASPIPHTRKTWSIPADKTEFLNELSFRSEIEEDKENIENSPLPVNSEGKHRQS